MESQLKMILKKIEYYSCHEMNNSNDILSITKEVTTEYMEIDNTLNVVIDFDLDEISETVKISYSVNLMNKVNGLPMSIKEFSEKYPIQFIALNEYCVDRCENRKVQFI